MNQLTKNEINKKFQIILAYGGNFSLEEKHIIEQAVRDIDSASNEERCDELLRQADDLLKSKLGL